MEHGTRAKNAVIRIGLFVCLVGVLTFIAYSNLRDWDRLEISYRYQDDGRVYGLYPRDRVSRTYETRGIKHKALRFQELVSSPVYLDVRYWQNFNHVKVELEYEKDSDVDFQIGYKVGKDFQWRLVSVPEGDPINLAIARNIRRAVMDISLAGEYSSYNNVHRWIFSSNNAQSLNKTIRIYGIKFTFTK